MEVQISPASSFNASSQSIHSAAGQSVMTHRDESTAKRHKPDFDLRCIVCDERYADHGLLYAHMQCKHPELCENTNNAMDVDGDNENDDLSDDDYGEYSSIFEPICELKQLDDEEFIINDNTPTPPIKQKPQKKTKAVTAKEPPRLPQVSQPQQMPQSTTNDQQQQQQQLQMQLFLQLQMQNQLQNQLQMQNLLGMLGTANNKGDTMMQAAMANMLRLFALGKSLPAIFDVDDVWSIWRYLFYLTAQLQQNAAAATAAAAEKADKDQPPSPAANNILQPVSLRKWILQLLCCSLFYIEW